MPDINAQISGALIALVGAVVGFVAALIRDFINRYYDERRHLRQLAIDSAIANWKQDFEVAKLIGELSQRPVHMAPLDSYVIHMVLLAELISSKRLTAANIEAELAKIRSVSQAATGAAKKATEERKK